jgi:hypothetical protein
MEKIKKALVIVALIAVVLIAMMTLFPSKPALPGKRTITVKSKKAEPAILDDSEEYEVEAAEEPLNN